MENGAKEAGNLCFFLEMIVNHATWLLIGVDISHDKRSSQLISPHNYIVCLLFCTKREPVKWCL